MTYFLNIPLVNLWFCSHLLTESEFLREILLQFYPVKIFEFPKISIKMKIFKAVYEAKITNHFKEIIQPPPNKIKAFYVSETKNFLRVFT